MKQAILLGAVLEPLGAVLLGGKVMETMRKGIADYKCYQDNPALLMYGMTCVIMAVALWLALATFLKMPVSTTHSCVGGVIGMALMTRGRMCVKWNYRPNQYCIKSNQNHYGDCQVNNMSWDNFPYVDGVAKIVISWLISPIFSGIAACGLYLVTRYGIMEHAESYNIVLVAFPVIVGFTTMINYVYIVLKGAKAWAEEIHTVGQVRSADEGELGPVFGWGAIFGLVAAAITVAMEYFIHQNIKKQVADGSLKTQEELHGQSKPIEIEEGGDKTASLKAKPVAGDQTFASFISSSMNKDALQCISDGTGDGNEDIVKRIHARVKYYDPKTEEVFKYVQVFTAMVDSFSHGANDVANAMGPFAAVFFTYQDEYVQKKPSASNTDAKWILLMGGLGMTLGLSTYGYKIMQAIGVELCSITPSRGYCIELGAALIITYGSSQGWPLSTTHCQVGATVAVGLVDGVGSVNGRELGIIIFGWVATLVVVGLTTALLVGPSPEPIKGSLGSDGIVVQGYCENYIDWKMQTGISRGTNNCSITCM